MAREHPATVRRIFAEGHTIGTHSEDHPLRFGRLSRIWSNGRLTRALFTLVSRLATTVRLHRFSGSGWQLILTLSTVSCGSRHLVSFSSDTVADDGTSHIIKEDHHTRYEFDWNCGKGILLLHDIHPATVVALTGLLKDLKQKGFHIVHVIPSSAN